MFKYNKEVSFLEESRTSHSMLVSLISQGECVLEFGCAKGELCAHIKETLGCKTYGIEINQHALEVAKAHLDGYICCDIENYDWESELSGIKFDIRPIIFVDRLSPKHYVFHRNAQQPCQGDKIIRVGGGGIHFPA